MIDNFINIVFGIPSFILAILLTIFVFKIIKYDLGNKNNYDNKDKK